MLVFYKVLPINSKCTKKHVFLNKIVLQMLDNKLFIEVRKFIFESFKDEIRVCDDVYYNIADICLCILG